DQAALGPRVMDVVVQEAGGTPLDVQAVRLRFAMAEMDMGTIETEAQPLGQGHFRARGSFFSMAGRWNVQATLARAGQEPLQIFLWIKDGFPGTAMPAWGQRLTDEQIWQLVTYLRTFGQGVPVAQAGPTSQPTLTPQVEVLPGSTQPALVPDVQEPLPPLVFA